MRSLRWFTLVWLMPLWLGVAAQGAELSAGSSAEGAAPAKALAEQPAAKPQESCGRFGTQVAFVDSPSEAARQALKEQKLVFVLHVSGLFEDPRFT